MELSVNIEVIDAGAAGWVLSHVDWAFRLAMSLADMLGNPEQLKQSERVRLYDLGLGPLVEGVEAGSLRFSLRLLWGGNNAHDGEWRDVDRLQRLIAAEQREIARLQHKTAWIGLVAVIVPTLLQAGRFYLSSDGPSTTLECPDLRL